MDKNYYIMCNMIESLERKKYTSKGWHSKLKPIEEGYNAGIDCCICVFERLYERGRFSTKYYDDIQEALRKERYSGGPYNRGDGFEDAVLSAMSMVHSNLRP